MADSTVDHSNPRIVVGVDGSEPSRRALRWAASEAELRGASLEVVHAWHFPAVAAMPYGATALDWSVIESSAQAVLDDEVKRVTGGGFSGRVSGVLVADTAGHALVKVAKDADLVVVGSRGHGGFAGLLLGSVSQQVVHHATCPVVVVPDEG